MEKEYKTLGDDGFPRIRMDSDDNCIHLVSDVEECEKCKEMLRE